MADPQANHSAHLSTVLDKMDGTKLSVTFDKNGPAGPAPAAPTEQFVGQEPAKVEAAPEPVEAPAEEAVVEPAKVEAPKPAAQKPAKPQAKPSPKQERLAKSLEIQRRAEAATRRARAEAGKLRAQPQAQPKPKPAQPDQSAQKAQSEIDSVRAQLQEEIRLVKTDPLGFAKRHGVSGADLAEYVRQGADPHTRANEQLRRETAQALQQLKAEADRKIAALQDTIVHQQEVDAQRNFFQFIEESKEANPEAFAALGSGLVFSDKEIWDTANHILETDADLRDNFDEDKLLEAVEVEARKDPRWSRLQALQKSKQAASKSNVASSKKPNVSEQEEVAEEEVEETPAQSAPRQAPRAPRNPHTGQFEQRSSTPFERHATHLENVLRNTRLY